MKKLTNLAVGVLLVLGIFSAPTFLSKAIPDLGGQALAQRQQCKVVYIPILDYYYCDPAGENLQSNDPKTQENSDQDASAE